MKTVIRQNQEQQYPCYKCANGDCGSESSLYVVLFTDFRTGIVVAVSPDSPHKLGTRSESWAEDEFANFEGGIEITV